MTPMPVLQDPLVGTWCRTLFEEGGVEDRLLVMLFLMAEQQRPCSLWNPLRECSLLALDVARKVFEKKQGEKLKPPVKTAVLYKRDIISCMWIDTPTLG